MRANALENRIAEYLREKFFVEENEDYLREAARKILEIIDRSKIHELDLMAAKLTLVKKPPIDCNHNYVQVWRDEDGFCKMTCTHCGHIIISKDSSK